MKRLFYLCLILLIAQLPFVATGQNVAVSDVVGEFSAKNVLINDKSHYTAYAREDLMLYADKHFIYFVASTYGVQTTFGKWCLENDSLVLDSEVPELSMECMGNYEFPIDSCTFKVLNLDRASHCWYHKGYGDFYFMTQDNDTILCRPDSLGYITLSKSLKIVKLWGDSYYLRSNDVYMPADKDLNFFVVKYSDYRQFAKEKWAMVDNNTIRPVDRVHGCLADYVLKRDPSWDTSQKWEQPTPAFLFMLRYKCGMYNNVQRQKKRETRKMIEDIINKD